MQYSIQTILELINHAKKTVGYWKKVSYVKEKFSKWKHMYVNDKII